MVRHHTGNEFCVKATGECAIIQRQSGRQQDKLLHKTQLQSRQLPSRTLQHHFSARGDRNQTRTSLNHTTSRHTRNNEIHTMQVI